MDYAKLIKELREKLLMTQQEFADYIGSTFISVNRWENGKFSPTMKMKRHLKELFIKHRIIKEEE